MATDESWACLGQKHLTTTMQSQNVIYYVDCMNLHINEWNEVPRIKKMVRHDKK